MIIVVWLYFASILWYDSCVVNFSTTIRFADDVSVVDVEWNVSYLCLESIWPKLTMAHLRFRMAKVINQNASNLKLPWICCKSWFFYCDQGLWVNSYKNRKKNDKNFKILLNKDSRYMQTNLHTLKGAMYINSLGMGQVMGVF